MTTLLIPLSWNSVRPPACFCRIISMFALIRCFGASILLDNFAISLVRSCAPTVSSLNAWEYANTLRIKTFSVLREISAQYKQTHAPLDDQTYAIVIRC